MRECISSLALCLLLYHRQHSCSAALPPNFQLGTCLTPAWVAQVESTLNISSTARKPDGSLQHPYLHAALRYPRYNLTDPRIQSATDLFSSTCLPRGDAFYATSANSTTSLNNITDINNTLILEYQDFATPRITTQTFAILASELLGYKISMYATPNYLDISNRLDMKNPQAQCTPTHVNLAIPSDVEAVNYDIGNAGVSGYYQLQGFYTIRNFVNNGLDASISTPTYMADYWRDYVNSDAIHHAIRASEFFSSSFYPPTQVFCPNGTIGCLNHCAKSYACTLKEQEGKECIVIIMISHDTAYGYPAAVASNLGIPAYFCYIGRPAMDQYILYAYKNNRGALFYRREPATIFFQQPNVFQRVSFPFTNPGRVALNTWKFGENGYGNVTNNPVDVEYPVDSLQKRYALNLEENQPVFYLLNHFKITDVQMYVMMQNFVSFTNISSTAVPNGAFSAACRWIQDNYNIWRKWLEPLPLCSIYNHVALTVNGCEKDAQSRMVSFQWIQPNIDNVSQPYNCDGGLRELPRPFETSRSCRWIMANNVTIMSWALSPPICDFTFLKYNVSNCTMQVRHDIRLFWKLPRADNASQSRECVDGYALTNNHLSVECEFVPQNSSIYAVITAFAATLQAAIVCGIIFVFVFRNAPIIRRSQPEFIMIMLLGALLIAAAVIEFGGEPTLFLCAARPTFLAFGFTSIFGALTLKSMRVYRVFMARSMKRVIFKSSTMIKLLCLMYLVDVVIISFWFIFDFPSPAFHMEDAVTLTWYETDDSMRIPVQRVECKSSSSIYATLLLFWKTILLCIGMYLSFKIRKVSTDFQESVWVFASSVVVMFASIMVLPIAYFMHVSAQGFLMVLSISLLFSTALVVGMMLIPKITRLKEQPRIYKASGATGDSAAASSADGTSEAEVPERHNHLKPKVGNCRVSEKSNIAK